MSSESALNRLTDAFSKARHALLAERGAHGHWEGELSSSALSTAAAVTALALVLRAEQQSKDASRASAHTERVRDLEQSVASGWAWLAEHANIDGGWGDTTKSISNLSTTTLCWAALGLCPQPEDRHRAVILHAERWLRQRTGGLEPDKLAPAIIARYGKDRTFSVPILTMCALAGRLGTGRNAWRWVIPLPFELAACPHQWFAALCLPVVSYALPALIAIGQAHHYHAPTRNPLRRWLREWARQRTLRVLTDIQPANGGFLEATPLTSFVVMSLAGSGQSDHPVTVRGVQFLESARRPDGSWPIDTNLATWVTTLAVNALLDSPPSNDTGGSTGQQETAVDLSGVAEWLGRQQYRVEHPYTHAAPGGWAWTDLPGGVPDADDTSGALMAWHAIEHVNPARQSSAQMALEWLVKLQNRDGGIPTFCRGWGTLPFDRSSADITAHAVRAWLRWSGEVSPDARESITKALQRAVRFLQGAQRPDGAWVPLWFGNQYSSTEENPTYGTARVLAALTDLVRDVSFADANESVWKLIDRGAAWLWSAQNPDGGWGGDLKTASTIEESACALDALALMILARDGKGPPLGQEVLGQYRRGIDWLIRAVETGEWLTPSPIGFYFAKLWYYERLYPMIFTVGALRVAMEVEGRFPRDKEL